MRIDSITRMFQKVRRLQLKGGLLAILALFSFAAVSCAKGVRTSEPQPRPKHRVAEEDTLCRVDASAVIGPVHRGLFGTNVEWFNNGNGLVKSDKGLDLNFVRLAKAQGVSLVRFPGGTFSDYYHWEDGVGPVEKRPVSKHYTDLGKSSNVFGTPELVRFCRAAGAEPLLTVNAGTGTAEEAAAWVKYCNAPDHSQRKADGFPEPLGVKLWEVGNELYLPGNPGEIKVAVTPEVYAKRFLEFAAKMRQADPRIQIIGIGTARANAVPLEHENWSEILLERGAHEMDYIAVHNSYFPVIFVDKGLDIRQVYQAMWAGPEAVDRSLNTLEALIIKHQKERDIGIAITEWGALFSFDREWVDHVKTMGTAVYAARMLQVYLQHSKVRVANYFKMTDGTPMGWVAYDGVPKVPYYAMQLLAHHFGSRVIQSTTQSKTFDSPQLRVMQSEKAVPEITACASLDDTGKTLYVNLVSRSWDTVHRVKLDLIHFKPADGPATAWSLSAPNVTDHNGRDVPADWFVPTDDPPRTQGFEGHIRVEKSAVDVTQPIVLPPYSVLTVEIRAAK